MKGINIYVKRNLVYENELSELDSVLEKEFGFDYETQEDFFIEGDYAGYADASPINIDHVIQELSNMKAAGATHVEIGYHCDHIGYIFEGYQITPMTETEVNQLKQKQESESK
jgi:hypothetical protein